MMAAAMLLLAFFFDTITGISTLRQARGSAAYCRVARSDHALKSPSGTSTCQNSARNQKAPALLDEGFRIADVFQDLVGIDAIKVAR